MRFYSFRLRLHRLDLPAAFNDHKHRKNDKDNCDRTEEVVGSFDKVFPDHPAESEDSHRKHEDRCPERVFDRFVFRIEVSCQNYENKCRDKLVRRAEKGPYACPRIGDAEQERRDYRNYRVEKFVLEFCRKFVTDHLVREESRKSDACVESRHNEDVDDRDADYYSDFVTENKGCQSAEAVSVNAESAARIFEYPLELVLASSPFYRSTGNDDADDTDYRFHEHSAETDEHRVFLFIKLLGSGSRSDDAVEAGDRAACYDDEKERNKRTLRRILERFCNNKRSVHVRVDNENSYESKRYSEDKDPA